MEPPTRGVKSILDTITTSLVAIAALSVIGFVANTWLRGAETSSQLPIGTQANELSVTTAPHPLQGAPLLGSRKARIAIIEYADFECPFCSQFVEQTWPTLKQKYIDTGKVLAAFRHLPLDNHQHAALAAHSAACAADQGRFWEMHDALFQRRGKLDDSTGRSLGLGLGLNKSVFAKCLDQGNQKIQADLKLARSYGLSGTPSFLIGWVQSDNTVKITDVLVGAQPAEQFTSVIDQLLITREGNTPSWLNSLN